MDTSDLRTLQLAQLPRLLKYRQQVAHVLIVNVPEKCGPFFVVFLQQRRAVLT